MGMPVLLYYLARHYTSSLLGWGPSYKLVLVQETAARGLQQVRGGCHIVPCKGQYMLHFVCVGVRTALLWVRS